MFNLFPKKKSVDEILEDARFKKEAENLATGVVNSVYEIIALKNELQHQLDVNQKLQVEIESLEHKLVAYQKITEGASSSISELTKEVKNLRHLKQENVELMERVNEIDNDVIRDLQDEVLVLKNDYAILKKEKKESFEILKKAIENEAARFHELVAKHTDKCIKLDAANKEIEKLKKDIVDYVFEKDNQVNFFEEELKRLKSITKEEYDQIPVIGDTDRFNNLLKKARDLTKDVEVDSDNPLDEQSNKEEPAFLNCACGDCHEKTKQYNQFQDDMYYQDAYANKKEISWEEAASDLALRVAKLEEHIRHVPKIMFKNDEQEDNNPLYKHY